MRITGGTLTGRTVDCPEGEIRPTMDRVRESVFSILCSKTQGASLAEHSFLDLFGGSGIISLEASSRGSDPVWLVENDPVKIETILENVSIAEKKIECKFTSAELFIKRCKMQFDIIFADPPFPYKFHRQLIESCLKQGLLKESGLFIMHRPKERPLPDKIGNEAIGIVYRIDIRLYGRSTVDFYKHISSDI